MRIQLSFTRDIQGRNTRIQGGTDRVAIAAILALYGCGDGAEPWPSDEVSTAGGSSQGAEGSGGDSNDKATCTDSNSSCAAWASSGECTKNPNYMLTGCCQSCQRVSGGDQCPQDPNKTARGVCGCGVREPVDLAGFRDAQGYFCADWKGYDCTLAAEQYGYTSTQETSIVNSCALSCGMCPNTGGGSTGGTTGGTTGGATCAQGCSAPTPICGANSKCTSTRWVEPISTLPSKWKATIDSRVWTKWVRSIIPVVGQASTQNAALLEVAYFADLLLS